MPKPLSCGGAESNPDDPLLPASRMEPGPPRAPGPHCQPPNNYKTTRLSGAQLSLVPLMILSVLHLLHFPFLHVTSPSFSLMFNLPSPFFLSLCPGQKRVFQTLPVQAAGSDHTFARGFLNILSVRSVILCTHYLLGEA